MGYLIKNIKFLGTFRPFEAVKGSGSAMSIKQMFYVKASMFC